MIVAAALTIVSTSLMTAQVYAGFLSTQQFDQNSPQINEIVRYAALSGITSVCAKAAGRISFAIWLLRLTSQRRYKAVLYVVIAMTGVVDTSIALYEAVGCNPASKRFTVAKAQECWSHNVVFNFSYLQGATDVASDLTLCIIPAFLIAQMQLPLRTKVSFMALCGIGVFAAAAALANTIEMASYASDQLKLTWLYHTAIWHAMEMDIIVIAASIPTIRPLFTLVSNRISGIRTLDVGLDNNRMMGEKTYLTSWTGYTSNQLAPLGIARSPDDRRLGNVIVIEGGIREDPKWHNGWYKKTNTFVRFDDMRTNMSIVDKSFV